MTWTVPLLGLGLAACALSAAVALDVTRPALGRDPYAETVERYFINPAAGELPRLRSRIEGEPGPVVQLEEPLDPGRARFVEASPLRRDILADDRALWHFRGEKLVGIVSGRYATRLPGKGESLWRGELRYRPSATGAPGAADLDVPQEEPIRFEPADPRLPGIDLLFTDRPPLTGDLPTAGRVDFAPEMMEGGRLAASRVDLHCGPLVRDADGRVAGLPAARLFRAGDQAMLLVERDDARSASRGGVWASGGAEPSRCRRGLR